MAKPCNCCSKLLVSCGIKRVWYSTESGEFQKERGTLLSNSHVSGGYRRRQRMKLERR
nr:putative deoxycytidylate deaminase [Marseillevirus futianmevirus]